MVHDGYMGFYLMKTICVWANSISTPIIFEPIEKRKRFINKNGDMPKINHAMNIRNIVFYKEELNDNNWLFLANDYNDILRAKEQIKFFEEYDSQVWILKD